MMAEQIEAHARRFAWRAQNIYGVADQANASLLYAHLSAHIANDPAILHLVVRADRLSLEWYSGQSQPHLELSTYRNGTVEKELLAYCESHGRWFEWLVGWYSVVDSARNPGLGQNQIR